MGRGKVGFRTGHVAVGRGRVGFRMGRVAVGRGRVGFKTGRVAVGHGRVGFRMGRVAVGHGVTERVGSGGAGSTGSDPMAYGQDSSRGATHPCTPVRIVPCTRRNPSYDHSGTTVPTVNLARVR